MVLIKSISGIRGTLGGRAGENLTPPDIVKFSAAYGTWVQQKKSKKRKKVIVGRDARQSGEMLNKLVVSTLVGLGIDVVDVGLATTPTVEMAVTGEKAQGGIILTASHNPGEWNALKLLNDQGEFITDEEGKHILELAGQGDFTFAETSDLGSISKADYTDKHIERVLNLSEVDMEAIKNAEFKVAIDCVNSVGGIALPRLLEKLGVMHITKLYCEPTGIFPHNPEPLPENLAEIADRIKSSTIDVGFVVDPDVDRLAIVMEDGNMFGEEYTLVAVADYILQQQAGNTVSNLSSTKALKDITEKHGGNHFASAVGEVNVVSLMKKKKAIIGGEGNGGVIFPKLHYGRDALVGIALFLTHLARSGLTCSQLRSGYPDYVISKNKIQLNPETDVDKIISAIKANHPEARINDTDGVKFSFDNEWVHLRKSNTEPIIRIYSESSTKEKADQLASRFIREISDML